MHGTSGVAHMTLIAATRSVQANPIVSDSRVRSTGKQTPPKAHPEVTTPIASARRLLKCWPATVRAGCTPNAIAVPMKRPWQRNTCQKCPGSMNDSKIIAIDVPSPAPTYSHCKKSVICILLFRSMFFASYLYTVHIAQCARNGGHRVHQSNLKCAYESNCRGCRPG
jgi:hypothetical protein